MSEISLRSSYKSFEEERDQALFELGTVQEELSCVKSDHEALLVEFDQLKIQYERLALTSTDPVALALTSTDPVALALTSTDSVALALTSTDSFPARSIRSHL